MYACILYENIYYAVYFLSQESTLIMHDINSIFPLHSSRSLESTIHIIALLTFNYINDVAFEEVN